MGFRERLAVLVAALLTVGRLATASSAFDPEQTFHKGGVLLSLEGGGGVETQLRENVPFSDIEFWNVGIRLSVIPFGTTGLGVLHNVLYGALELGLEPWFQQYTHPSNANWVGLALVGRYHFLGLGRLVPWVEWVGAAGGTDLTVPEIRSRFAFMTDVGVGASVFLTDQTALYRLPPPAHLQRQHIESQLRLRVAHRGYRGDLLSEVAPRSGRPVAGMEHSSKSARPAPRGSARRGARRSGRRGTR